VCVVFKSYDQALSFMMCAKNNPYLIKCVVGFVIMVICVIISISLYFGYGGGAEAKIEMNGDKNKSIVQQSAGLHLIEVNNSGDCKGNWSYAEYSVVLLVFVFILKCSHLCHYCFVTKKLVKKKVTQIGIQMKDLGKQPGDVVIVPGI